MLSSQTAAFPTTTTNSNVYVILRSDIKKSVLTSYLHAAVYCPTKSTFIQAIKNGNFITWPGITTNGISKLLPPSIPNIKDHMK